jgi:hypothetical protein
LWVSSNGRKKINKIEEEASSEILAADTDSGNQVRRLAIGKTIMRRRKKRNSSSSKPQQKLPQQTLASEITNPSALPCSFRSQRKGTVHQT